MSFDLSYDDFGFAGAGLNDICVSKTKNVSELSVDELTERLNNLMENDKNLLKSQIITDRKRDALIEESKMNRGRILKNSKDIDLVSKELKYRDELKVENELINIENMKLLTVDEINIIKRNTNRQDFRKMVGVEKRFVDLEKVYKTVIQIKQQYPNWVLKNLYRKSYSSYEPPSSIYEYVFNDVNMDRCYTVTE